jgi:hypothetical protein
MLAGLALFGCDDGDAPAATPESTVAAEAEVPSAAPTEEPVAEPTPSASDPEPDAEPSPSPATTSRLPVAPRPRVAVRPNYRTRPGPPRAASDEASWQDEVAPPGSEIKTPRLDNEDPWTD